MHKIEPYPIVAAEGLAKAIASAVLGLGSILKASLLRYSGNRRERARRHHGADSAP